MNRLLITLTLTSLIAACASEDAGPDNRSPRPTDDNSRSIRAAEATTEVVTMSAGFAAIAAATSRSSIAEVDVESRVADIIGEDCGSVEMTATTVSVDLSDCAGASGTIDITLNNLDCLDPQNPDPTCLEQLDASIVLDLEIEGLSIDGSFTVSITETSLSAEGSLAIDAINDSLDVDFDLQLDENGECILVNGVLAVSTDSSAVSVTAVDVNDCGGCPDSGSLLVDTGNESVAIEFATGDVTVTDANGEIVVADLACEAL